MRVARWRSVLVPMVVVVAGCLPRTTDLPASFADQVLAGELTFEAASPSSDAIPAATLLVQLGAAAGASPMLRTRAVPMFGVLACVNAARPCEALVNRGFQEQPAPAWLVLYPDRVGPDGATGWVLADGVRGVPAGFSYYDPLEVQR